MPDNASKTLLSETDVNSFLDGITDDQRRRDALILVELMRDVTGQSPVIWGTSLVGFGSHHYKYQTGREGDVPAVSFAPRKAQTVLYLTGGVAVYKDLLPQLGRHATGVGCLYLKRVDEADPAILREIVDRSYRTASSG